MEYVWALYMPEEYTGNGRGTGCIDANFLQKKSFINHFPELSVLLEAPSGSMQLRAYVEHSNPCSQSSPARVYFSNLITYSEWKLVWAEELFQNTLGNKKPETGLLSA